MRTLSIVTVLIFSMSGCFSRSESETEHHVHNDSAESAEAHRGQDERGEEHADHEDGAEPFAFDRAAQAQLERRRCEHDVPILDCDECRYEVGAVDVSPSLLDPGGDDLLHTEKLRPTPLPRVLRLTGEVAFDERRVAHVSPRVGGLVRRALVTLGDEVEAGEALIVMDSVELGRLRSSYLQARARRDLAQKNYEREVRLHERRIASGREKLQAETALREAKIELASVREQLRLLGLSQRGLGRGGAPSSRAGVTTLRAPMSGTVVSMHAVNGERLSTEEPVVTIADLSKVWVWADVYERDLGPLIAASRDAPLTAKVSVAAFPERRFVGAIDYVGAVMEEATRTVRIRVAVDNDERLLRPGMFADVAVELGAEEEALVVPAEAVMEHEEQDFVFLAIGPRRFLRRDVTTRSLAGAQVALVEGVDAGEEVVVRGAFLLKSDVLREQMGAGCAH